MENLTRNLIFVIVVLVFISMLGIYFSNYFNNQTIEITVADKYIKRNNDNDEYMIVDEDKNTYKITDLFFKFKFNSTDIYNSLEIGKTYKIKISGFRIKLFSEYPNINEIIE